MKHSEGESKPEGQRPLVREFGRQVKRVEVVVLVGEIQKSHGEFRVPSPKAVSGKCVKLPEVVTGNIRRVTTVALLIPDRLETEEQAGRVIDDSEELQLMKNGFFVLLQPEWSNHNGRGWNIGQAPFELRVAEAICCAKSELITHKLVQRDGD